MLRSHESDINQSTLMNFVPTRPIEEIAREYVEAFCNLYDPIRYLERCYRCVVRMPPPPPRPRNPDSGWIELPSWTDLRAVLKVAWRQGAVRKSRWRFWRRLACMLARNPGQLGRFLILCAHNEHFIHFRETVRKEIERQIAQLSRG